VVKVLRNKKPHDMFSGKEYKCDSQTDNRKTDKQKITLALLYTAL